MSGYVDITDQVEKKGVYALNQLKSAGPENVFIGDKTLACRSDTDSQLIICFPFQQVVRLFALVLEAPEGEEPTVIKLFINRPTLGFEELEDSEPTQVLRLRPEDFAKEKQHRLTYVKFQNVNSVHVFFDREGGERCALSSIKFIGTPVAGTDMKALKKMDEH